VENPPPNTSQEKTEAELIFAKHWSECLPKLRAYVMQHMSDRSEVDDVIQETSLVLWQKWAEFKAGTNFLAWAKSVAHFKVLKMCYQNKRKPIGVTDEILEILQPETEAFDVSVDERIPHLQLCLKQLDSEDLSIIRLRYEKKQEGKEIAEHMGLRPNYLYKKIGEIRKQLARCIQQRVAIARTKKS
jgi:RNA polymerase sigma-70 factor (ECF subfamily)